LKKAQIAAVTQKIKEDKKIVDAANDCKDIFEKFPVRYECDALLCTAAFTNPRDDRLSERSNAKMRK
jgi:hypothetical protein